MLYEANMSRGQKALFAAQQIVRATALRTVRDVLNDLQGDPCVSFIWSWKNSFEYEPNLYVAVQMLEYLVHSDTVRAGRLYHSNAATNTTPTNLASAQKLFIGLQDAFAASGSPYALAYHVEGHKKIQFNWGGQTRDEAIRSLTDEIGQLVTELAGSAH